MARDRADLPDFLLSFPLAWTFCVPLLTAACFCSFLESEALRFSDLVRLEIHANAEQLEILKEAIALFNPILYTLEIGFRN